MAQRISGFVVVLFSVLFITACNLPFSNNNISDPSNTSTPEEGVLDPSSDPQVTALNALRESSTSDLSVQFDEGFPVFISGRVPVAGQDPGERAKAFIAEYKALYLQNDPDLDLQVRRVGGVDGEDVVFFQTYKGLEIFGAELVVNLDGPEVYATYGNLLTEISLEVSPQITRTDAETAAQTEADSPDAVILGNTQLVILDRSLLEEVESDPRLAWRVTLGQPVNVLMFIDALTSEVVFQYGLALDALDLDFKDANYTDNSACYFLSPDDQTIGDESGVLNAAYLADGDAVNGYQFSFDVYDFFLTNFRRSSYNGTGGGVEVYVHANVPNAQYIGWGCDMIEFADGWVSWDVMVHEFTHAVIGNTSGLIYANQSGALNEGYSDIMAAFADPDDWTLAEDRTSGMGPIRDMSNPPAFGDPDRFSNYFITSGDNGGVHTNSGILNKSAFLVSDGGTFNGWTISGLGRSTMASLYYSVMVSLPNSASFMTARNATVARADATLSPRDACQVQNAFAAVELGEGDRDCDGIDDSADPNPDGDFIPSDRDNCPTVNNPRQEDMDFDGIGDACDNDIDGDFIANGSDNCPLVNNPSQADVDGNGIGNACQDSDGDTVIDARDNCPATPNRLQEDMDGDGDGDACDTNIDNDSFQNGDDLCPFTFSSNGDRDGDGVGDECDICPANADPEQRDTDGDGIGDACDADRDGDGLANDDDNCPNDYNSDQFDLDNNGVGLACDENENQIREGIEFPIDIFGDPGWLTRFPIPVCLAGCPDSFGENYLVGILIGLNQPVNFWVSDDLGKTVSKGTNLGDGFSRMEFSPMGGRDYFLNLAFGNDFPEDGQAEGSMMMYSTSAAAEDEPEEEETATPTPMESTGPVIEYYADPTEVEAGKCTTIYWNVQNVQKVEFGGFEQEFEGSYYDCICKTSTYPMTITYLDNTQEKFYVTIEVEGACETPTPPTPTDTPKPEKPAAPSSLVANANVCTAFNYNVHLTWKDNANNETGFRVYREGNLIATLGPNVTEYNDQPPYGGPYTYKVESYNGGGASPSNNADDSGCIY